MTRSIILASCGAVGLTAMATGEPIEPHKVPTVIIRKEPATGPNPALAPPTDYPAVPTVKVQPSPKDGPSVPRFGDDREAADSASKTDARAVRTIPIGPDADTSFEADRHFAPRAGAPVQSEPK